MKELDFNCYNKLEDCIDYDGFIAPNGDFYRVSLTNKHNPTHNAWANDFVAKKLDYIKHLSSANESFLYTMSRLNGKLEILIHFYGYIYYGHDSFNRMPIIIYPNYDINNKSVSTEQYNKLFDILYERDELMYLPLMTIDESNDINHDKYVDMLINNNRK